MPYIIQSRRLVLDPLIDAILRAELPDTDYELRHQDVAGLMMPRTEFSDGDANYVITRILIALCGSGRYVDLQRVDGLLDMACKEFYRRRAAPYEDEKAEENGDVFGEKNEPETIDNAVHLCLCKQRCPIYVSTVGHLCNYPEIVVYASIHRLRVNRLLEIQVSTDGLITVGGVTDESEPR